MTYTEQCKVVDLLIEEKKKVSADRYGLTPARGKEAEFEEMQKRIDQARKELRRIRYGTDE